MIQHIQVDIDPIVQNHLNKLEEFTKSFADYTKLMEGILTGEKEFNPLDYMKLSNRIQSVSTELETSIHTLIEDNTVLTIKGSKKQ